MEFNFINQEESQPVSPTGQYFTSSVISVSVIGVLETEVPIEIDDSHVEALLKDVFLPINPRFSSIMVIDKRGVKQWKKVEVEIKDHMYKPIFPEGKSVEFYDDCFNQYLSKLAMDQLSQSRPLWEIHIIKYPTKNSAGNVVFKLHHALGDGFSLMGALLSCLQRAENPQLPLTFPALMNQNMNTDDDHKGIFKNVTGIFNTVSDFGWSLLKSSVIEDGKSPIRSGDDGVESRPITITTMTFTLDQIKKMKEILQVSAVHEFICLQFLFLYIQSPFLHFFSILFESGGDIIQAHSQFAEVVSVVLRNYWFYRCILGSRRSYQSSSTYGEGANLF